MERNPKVDLFLEEGCGRCKLYQTPDCKVHQWQELLVNLREIVLSCGLKEELKWAQPCYTFKGKNVLIVSAFKAHATISFFKGSLLNNEHQLLVSPGENSQATRQLNYTNLTELLAQKDQIKALIFEAIELEKQGKKVVFKKKTEEQPEELKALFDQDSDFRVAFEALTPGRQRGYLIYFSQAKQSATRIKRIEKYRSLILQGLGIHDEYKMNQKK